MNKRLDTTTSALIAEALKLQRNLGFEPAFLMLRARDIDPELARSLLELQSDRRKAVEATELLSQLPKASTRSS